VPYLCMFVCVYVCVCVCMCECVWVRALHLKSSVPLSLSLPRAPVRALSCLSVAPPALPSFNHPISTYVSNLFHSGQKNTIVLAAGPGSSLLHSPALTWARLCQCSDQWAETCPISLHTHTHTHAHTQAQAQAKAHAGARSCTHRHPD